MIVEVVLELLDDNKNESGIASLTQAQSKRAGNRAAGALQVELDLWQYRSLPGWGALVLPP